MYKVCQEFFSWVMKCSASQLKHTLRQDISADHSRRLGEELLTNSVFISIHNIVLGITWLKNDFRGLSSENVSVDFKPDDYSRVSRDAEQERSIEEFWAERKKISPQIYNGAKFRLHGVTLNPPEGMPVLQMGLTSYKEMLGTHYAPDREELISTVVIGYCDYLILVI